MMTSSNRNISRVTGPLCGEFTGHHWIPLTKASDAELWYFLWSTPEQIAWVNTGDDGGLRRHHAHYDLTVMCCVRRLTCCLVWTHPPRHRKPCRHAMMTPGWARERRHCKDLTFPGTSIARLLCRRSLKWDGIECAFCCCIALEMLT